MNKEVTTQSSTGDQTSTGVSASVFIKLGGKRVQKHNLGYMFMQRYFCLCCQEAVGRTTTAHCGLWKVLSPYVDSVTLWYFIAATGWLETITVTVKLRICRHVHNNQGPFVDVMLLLKAKTSPVRTDSSIISPTVAPLVQIKTVWKRKLQSRIKTF